MVPRKTAASISALPYMVCQNQKKNFFILLCFAGKNAAGKTSYLFIYLLFIFIFYQNLIPSLFFEGQLT